LQFPGISSTKSQTQAAQYLARLPSSSTGTPFVSHLCRGNGTFVHQPAFETNQLLSCLTFTQPPSLCGIEFIFFLPVILIMNAHVAFPHFLALDACN
jgi:hypothetical protein